jgi:hypothetical protein
LVAVGRSEECNVSDETLLGSVAAVESACAVALSGGAGEFSLPLFTSSRIVSINPAVATMAATPGQNHFGQGCTAANSFADLAAEEPGLASGAALATTGATQAAAFSFATVSFGGCFQGAGFSIAAPAVAGLAETGRSIFPTVVDRVGGVLFGGGSPLVVRGSWSMDCGPLSVVGN